MRSCFDWIKDLLIDQMNLPGLAGQMLELICSAAKVNDQQALINRQYRGAGVTTLGDAGSPVLAIY